MQDYSLEVEEMVPEVPEELEGKASKQKGLGGGVTYISAERLLAGQRSRLSCRRVSLPAQSAALQFGIIRSGVTEKPVN